MLSYLLAMFVSSLLLCDRRDRCVKIMLNFVLFMKLGAKN